MNLNRNLRAIFGLWILLIFTSGAASAQTIVVPQVAAGEGWKTIFRFYNGTADTVAVTLNFWKADGFPMTLPIRMGPFPTSNSIGTRVLPLASKNVIVIETDWTGTLYQGWATAITRATLEVTVRHSIPGRPDVDATANITKCSQRLVVPFNNTNGNSTGVALVNQYLGENNLALTFYSDAGVKLDEKMESLPRGQLVFSLPERYPVAADRIGTMEIHSSTVALCGIGLTFNPSGGFSTTLLAEASY